jgi:DNA replication protein DnaC
LKFNRARFLYFGIVAGVEPRRRIQMASSIAKFPFVRTLDQFEFDAQPSLDPKLIQELATARWVANGDALLLLGPPGVRKTHRAVALGREVIHRGYTTLFTSATAIVTALTKAITTAGSRSASLTSQSPSC